MTLEARACQACTDQCRIERRSDLILEAFNGGEITEQQALQRVSTMTQEARQIGCPNKEMLKIRWETQAQINPRLAEADRIKNAARVPKLPTDPANIYFQERREASSRGSTYGQSASKERFGKR